MKAKRASLTPKQRRDMLFLQDGRCASCGDDIRGQKSIAEHTFPVALGNPKKPDCLLCRPCADTKTNGGKATTYGSDKHAIAKVKRLRGETKTGPSRPIPKHVSPWPPRGSRKLQSRKFGT